MAVEDSERFLYSSSTNLLAFSNFFPVKQFIYWVDMSNITILGSPYTYKLIYVFLQFRLQLQSVQMEFVILAHRRCTQVWFNLIIPNNCD